MLHYTCTPIKSLSVTEVKELMRGVVVVERMMRMLLLSLFAVASLLSASADVVKAERLRRNSNDRKQREFKKSG